MDSPSTVILLRAGHAEAGVAPHIGGSLTHFHWHDGARTIHWLRWAAAAADRVDGTAERLACFPLVPFSNRIRDGRFTFRPARRQAAVESAPAAACRARARLAVALGRRRRRWSQRRARIRSRRRRVALPISSAAGHRADGRCAANHAVGGEPRRRGNAGRARPPSVFSGDARLHVERSRRCHVGDRRRGHADAACQRRPPPRSGEWTPARDDASGQRLYRLATQRYDRVAESTGHA